MPSKTINFDKCGWLCGPRASRVAGQITESFEMRGSFWLALSNSIQPPSYLAELRSTTRQDPLFRAYNW